MKNLDTIKKDLEEVIEFFQEELKNIRTGRANPSLVEDIKVEYFGQPTPLNQMSSVSASDARSLVITPWNKDNLVDIEKAINESDLGINPVNDGSAIRLNFPALTEERRKELMKVAGKKAEETRIKIRQNREEVWENIQKQEKDGEISEDDKFRNKDKLQEIVDEFNKKIEEMVKKKEGEIMTV